MCRRLHKRHITRRCARVCSCWSCADLWSPYSQTPVWSVRPPCWCRDDIIRDRCSYEHSLRTPTSPWVSRFGSSPMCPPRTQPACRPRRFPLDGEGLPLPEGSDEVQHESLYGRNFRIKPSEEILEANQVIAILPSRHQNEQQRQLFEACVLLTERMYAHQLVERPGHHLKHAVQNQRLAPCGWYSFLLCCEQVYMYLPVQLDIVYQEVVSINVLPVELKQTSKHFLWNGDDVCAMYQ